MRLKFSVLRWLIASMAASTLLVCVGALILVAISDGIDTIFGHDEIDGEICADGPCVDKTELPVINLAVVTCGERFEETTVMLKSAVLFGTAPIVLHVFADDENQDLLDKELEPWNSIVKWRDNLLRDIDSLLYMDTDTIFLSPPDEIWAHWRHFNSTQLVGMAPESEDASTNWYRRFARHPFYEPYGLNSGVMLMNLTRLRNWRWHERLDPLLMKYRYNITWGDQDLINIIFHKDRDKVFVYDCSHNFRPDHCMYLGCSKSSVGLLISPHAHYFPNSPSEYTVDNCKVAHKYGARVIHGSRGYFHIDNKQPVFKVLYDTFREHNLDNSLDGLVEKLKIGLKPLVGKWTCAQALHVFLKRIEEFVKEG